MQKDGDFDSFSFTSKIFFTTVNFVKRVRYIQNTSINIYYQVQRIRLSRIFFTSERIKFWFNHLYASGSTFMYIFWKGYLTLWIFHCKVSVFSQQYWISYVDACIWNTWSQIRWHETLNNFEIWYFVFYFFFISISPLLFFYGDGPCW